MAAFEPPTLTCASCGKPFELSGYGPRSGVLYCSRQCSDRAHHGPAPRERARSRLVPPDGQSSARRPVPYGRVEWLSRMAVDSDSAQLHIFRPIGEGQSMLSTLNVLERVRAAKDRARVRAELIAAGLQPADADAWCDRWESEARRKTLHAGAHDFWTLGSAWIKERQRQP